MVIGGYLFIAFIVTYRLVPETLKRKQTNNDDTEMGEELLTHDALIENEIENDNENDYDEDTGNDSDKCDGDEDINAENGTGSNSSDSENGKKQKNK